MTLRNLLTAPYFQYFNKYIATLHEYKDKTIKLFFILRKNKKEREKGRKIVKSVSKSRALCLPRARWGRAGFQEVTATKEPNKYSWVSLLSCCHSTPDARLGTRCWRPSSSRTTEECGQQPSLAGASGPQSRCWESTRQEELEPSPGSRSQEMPGGVQATRVL